MIDSARTATGVLEPGELPIDDYDELNVGIPLSGRRTSSTPPATPTGRAADLLRRNDSPHSQCRRTTHPPDRRPQAPLERFAGT
ncbi:hypothetical protein MLGJGCBP_01253 [Rhodococcus sp. T7]|uniref:Uncharacterized protein n=2 Tax=Rhodococcus opacus TaxID=37919 RepID=C1BCC4_RHOOB|nr:hypothetical protein W59_10279 [Rhodococcus opacus RKJ300 = JCM 13270]KAF0957275.1 hypothetical protein MLGJGCBP_09105 [Rhodococcus sp. T7]KAF0965601.1 hypothetical protein MLGJGCBP_01253 [Rhodococcus sp. T7]BAH55979.1 hypothetical protein ROP_pROB01-04800 [Rhodococcus opacus B4]